MKRIPNAAYTLEFKLEALRRVRGGEPVRRIAREITAGKLRQPDPGNGSTRRRPAVTLYPEAKRRVRWLNKDEVSRLLNALPSHQRQPARFALATGLRQANVLQLKWPEVDLARRTAWVHADEAKGREAIDVPLNDEAMAVLNEEKGKHPERVFTYKGRPLGQLNTTAWRNALKRAGIKNFRWHDLRHVWATGHVMAGTTIAELQELGALKSELMVKRYAHFAPEQLRSAATRLGTFLGTPGSAENAEARTTS